MGPADLHPRQGLYDPRHEHDACGLGFVAHIKDRKSHEIVTQGGDGRIVETIPGWTHNVSNIGDDELVVMVWANEIFDRQKPDTIAQKVQPA